MSAEPQHVEPQPVGPQLVEPQHVEPQPVEPQPVEPQHVEPRYDVVWPSAPRGVQARRLAERVPDLAGRTVAFLWDYMFRGDELFPVIERELTARFPGVRVVGYEAFGNVHGPDEHQVVGDIPSVIAARGVDAVVAGVGA